jgi:hypothetical protein
MRRRFAHFSVDRGLKASSFAAWREATESCRAERNWSAYSRWIALKPVSERGIVVMHEWTQQNSLCSCAVKGWPSRRTD